MKKRFISLWLTLLLMVTPAFAVFSDISDSRVSQTASVLNALGIMQGVGGSSFAPGKALTRAQFCKLAVTAMGVSDVSAYASYTIFPDVKHSHWAAPYINAAVRHPDLKDKGIIRGYADGKFGPDKVVSYGEVCTMLLRMLGYTEEDIGPFWPADYIAKAQSIGLTDGVKMSAARAAVKRGEAAIMLLNTLNADKKGEEGSTLLDKVASSTVKNCILLETSKTDSKLAADEALFFEDGTVESTRKTAGTLDNSLIGVYGTVVIGKGDSKVAVGMVPNNNKTETYEVVTAEPDRITTKTGTLRPARETPIYISREEHKLNPYSDMWASIQAGDTLTLYYNEYGSLQLIAVLPKTTSGNTHSFVYGMLTSPRIPNEYKIMKNGAVIDSSKLKKYDVVTLDASSKQALVSDTKISGQYTEGSSTYSHPTRVTVLGQKFAIPETAAATFKNIKLNDYITLLFDTDGNVAAAYPKKEVSAEMQGIVTKLEENKATVALTGGLVLRDIPVEKNTTNDLLGRLVTISSSGDTATLIRRTLSGKANGIWSIEDGTLGNNVVSSKVRVYEEILHDAPLYAINVSDIDLVSIPSSQIKYTVQDNAGTITNIILGDVTGNSWYYGIAFDRKQNNAPHGNNVVTLPVDLTSDSIDPDDSKNIIKHWNQCTDAEQEWYRKHHSDDFKENYSMLFRIWDTTGKKTIEYSYTMLSGSGYDSTPVAIPKGYATDRKELHTVVSTQKLTLIDTVPVSAFDGSTGVRTKDGYYELTDDIGVYVSDQNKFISLQSARSNYKTFRVYANTSAADGGKIRVITAS